MKIVNIWVGSMHEGDCKLLESQSESKLSFRLTLLWYLHPGVVFVEGISVPVERWQVALTSGPSSIHRSVLLMAENYRFGCSTFSVCLEAL
jgi:hypothetical protein